MVLAAQVAEELVDVGGGPGPRHLVAVLEEPGHQPGPGVDGGQREVAGQLLVPPAVEHVLDDLVGPVPARQAPQRHHPAQVVAHSHLRHLLTGSVI